MEQQNKRVARKDPYTIAVGGIAVRATPDQERRIREMDAEEQDRFLTIMGKKA